MPNQHTQHPGETQRSRILAFVQEHPDTTTHDLRNAFGWELSYIGMYLNRLKVDGLVKRERNRGETLGRWSAVGQAKAAGMAKAPSPARPVQRDPLLWAMFGGQP